MYLLRDLSNFTVQATGRGTLKLPRAPKYLRPALHGLVIIEEIG